MSRHSPTGFAFSMLIEIAAVVIIVSLLPRFDLRPKANAAAPTSLSEFAPSLLTAYGRPRVNDRTTLAPPLLDPAPIDRRFVEQRLDLASQQLVNSVGSAVSTAAADLAAAIRPSTQPTPAPLATPTEPERQVTLLPMSAAGPLPAATGSFPTQPRAWRSY